MCQKVPSLGRWVFQNYKASTFFILKLKHKCESSFDRRLFHRVTCLSSLRIMWTLFEGGPHTEEGSLSVRNWNTGNDSQDPYVGGFFFSSLLFFSFSFLFSSLVTWKCKMFLLSLVLRSLKGKSNQTSILLADSLCGRCLLKQSDTVTDRQRVPLGGATEDRPSQFPTQHNSSWFL